MQGQVVVYENAFTFMIAVDFVVNKITFGDRVVVVKCVTSLSRRVAVAAKV